MKLLQDVYGLGKKIADKGGDFMATRIMLQPSIDHDRGVRADEQRHEVLRRRESRANDKAMGY